MRSSVSPVVMRNNFMFSPAVVAPEQKAIVSNEVLAPLEQSMDVSISKLDYDRQRSKSRRTVVADVRSCGEGACYLANPNTSSTSWSGDVLHRSFNFYMQPTICLSQPFYWASKHFDKSYECCDVMSGLILCPVAVTNLICSSAMVAVSAPFVYGVDRTASVCHIPLKPFSQEFNKNIEMAIFNKDLPLLIKLTKERTKRNLILIDYCISIMNLTAQEFAQAITMKQRIQLYSHMVDRLRFYQDTIKYKINGPYSFSEKFMNFIEILLSSDISLKQLTMLDLVLQIETKTASAGFRRSMAHYVDAILWNRFGNEDRKKSRPLWINYSFDQKKDPIFRKILRILNQYDLLSENFTKILPKLESRMESREKRLLFCFGSRESNSSVRTLFNNPAFDRNILPFIFEMSGFPREDIPELKEPKQESSENVRESGSSQIFRV